MLVDIQYGITYGRLDSSDWIPYEAELTDKEEAIYNKAVRLRMDLNEIPEMEDAIARVYPEIEDEEIGSALENGDEFAMECQGCLLVDPDEINDKVADRDPHTLEYFGLTDLSDDELDDWDANDYDMPTIAEFNDGFKPCSPFDGGWSLNIEFINPWEDEELTEEEARIALTELFGKANGDYSEVKDYIERCAVDFVADDVDSLDDLAVLVAEERGITDYE